MAIEVINAVWKHSQSKNRARLVLLAIADMQGEIGAWPSLATIAKMVNASERSVQRDIQTLVELGELRVEMQNAPVSRQYKSNLYWVILPGVTDSAPGVTDSTSGVTDLAPGVTAGGVQSLKETITKPLKEPDETKFEIFWDEYPKKKEKPEAKKAFHKALKKVDFDTLLNAVKRYKIEVRNTEFRFIKYPATWLNKEAWSDITEQQQEGGSFWDTIE